MIPDYETLMRPLLEVLSDGRTRTIAECRTELQARFEVTADELEQMIPSGRTPLFSSRVHWAKTYLGKAAAVESPVRGQVRITDRGMDLLASTSRPITTAMLTDRYDEMRAWRLASRGSSEVGNAKTPEPLDSLSPEEALATNYQRMREVTEADVLEHARSMRPAKFEQLVVDLLMGLGYGGSSGVGIRLGRGGDGGVDGLIQQDKLGIEQIYIQAKRWQGSVGPSVVREFGSSLRLKGASKGVIITTSYFTGVARSEAERLGVILVDGDRLAELMFDTGLGVSIVSQYIVKRVDSGYFEDETEA